MTILDKNIHELSLLGDFIAQFVDDKRPNAKLKALNSLFYDDFRQAIENTHFSNPWFTPQSIKLSLQGIRKFLHRETLQIWTEKYTFKNSNKTVALILAGNIPLVGFHDILSVLISGHKIKAKLSSKDDKLIKIVRKILIAINPEYSERFRISEELLKDFDAVIATGSNNSGRYFDYYFGKYPHIIRNNRNAVAILNGDETAEELKALADDIFLYYGLGCRNVSKLFIPKNYDFAPLFSALEAYNEYINHNKYANNYEYRRTIYQMNQVPHLDTGFSLFKEDTQIASPIAVIFYEFYENPENLKARLAFENDKIQCIVANQKEFSQAINFGQAQFPEVWDYADNVDSLEFLAGL